MYSASTSFTSVWKGIEGSETVEVCLTCSLFAKSLRFLGWPLVKISLHLRLMVDAFSSHQPFSTSSWTLSENGEQFHYPFLLNESFNLGIIGVFL